MFKERSLTPVLIIVVLVAILGITGGLYYLGRQTAPKLQTPGITSSQSAIKPDSSSIPDDTTNWKTYDAYIDFSFKYPPAYYLYDHPGAGANYLADSKSTYDKFTNNQILGDNEVIITFMSLIMAPELGLANSSSIQVNDQVLQTLVNRKFGRYYSSGYEVIPYEKIEISGKSAAKVTKDNKINLLIPYKPNKDYYFLWLSVTPANSTQVKIFNQLFSTLKFAI